MTKTNNPPPDREALRHYAGTLLTSRLLSAGTLREKLGRKGGREEDIAEVISWAENIGLLNDREYAAALVQYGNRRRWGLYKIKTELSRRHVPKELWEEALEELEDPEESIRVFLAQKITDPADPKQCRRAFNALIRRGYPLRAVREAMEQYPREEDGY